MKSQNNLGSLTLVNERIGASRSTESSRHRKAGPSRLEAAARSEFELRAGRPIREAEWEALKARLVEFARLLRDWHQQTTIIPVHHIAELTAPSEDLPNAA
jgi:hypothetical protein